MDEGHQDRHFDQRADHTGQRLPGGDAERGDGNDDGRLEVVYGITMGCGDACPVFPGKRQLDWALEDPACKGVEAVRTIRDESRTRVEALITEIDAQHA